MIDKSYSYFRLVHDYKLGEKVRHQTLLNMGKPEGIEPSHHKALANRIETLLTVDFKKYASTPKRLFFKNYQNYNPYPDYLMRTFKKLQSVLN